MINTISPHPQKEYQTTHQGRAPRHEPLAARKLSHPTAPKQRR